jgi:hypothetical protein
MNTTTKEIMYLIKDLKIEFKEGTEVLFEDISKNYKADVFSLDAVSIVKTGNGSVCEVPVRASYEVTERTDFKELAWMLSLFINRFKEVEEFWSDGKTPSDTCVSGIKPFDVKDYFKL